MHTYAYILSVLCACRYVCAYILVNRYIKETSCQWCVKTVENPKHVICMCILIPTAYILIRPYYT